jgi:hypothetical protein
LIIGVKPNETKGTQLLEKLAYPTMQEHLWLVKMLLGMLSQMLL